MGKFLMVVFILFAGFFIAGMFSPLMRTIVNIARLDTASPFALAVLGTFIILPLIWVFVRAYNELRHKD